MLGLLLVGTYPVVLAALLSLGHLGTLPPALTASSLAGVGTLIAVVPVVALVRNVDLPPLFTRLGVAFGAAAFVGGLIAARTLPTRTLQR